MTQCWDTLLKNIHADITTDLLINCSHNFTAIRKTLNRNKETHLQAAYNS